ncbi:hypothetical protein [Paenibacillus faecalis]|nr:hypothetical protein [Paenibacillus faecalis]
MQQGKMGYASEEKLLIVNADDYGMCCSANAVIERLLREEAISASGS